MKATYPEIRVSSTVAATGHLETRTLDIKFFKDSEKKDRCSKVLSPLLTAFPFALTPAPWEAERRRPQGFWQ